MLESCEHALEPLPREPRPRRDAEACELQHGVRLLPGEEVAELVGADQEERIRVAALAEQVNRPGVSVEHDLAPRERGPRQRQARLGVALDALVARIRDDEDDEAVEREAPLGLLDERDVPDVRRIERTAEEAGQRNSSTSSPTTTSSPSFTPAARSASSSASPEGGRPMTR
jgi:hypothetical protein